jgi:hypothetical protein
MLNNPLSVTELPPVAAGPLAAWEDLARGWATFRVYDVDPGAQAWNLRCASCLGGICRLTDPHGKPYPYSDADMLALVVIHLRQSHMDLDPDR